MVKASKHTGRTDLDLTDTGECQAKLAAEAGAILQLRDRWWWPRRRALLTAELASLTSTSHSPAGRMGLRRLRGLTTVKSARPCRTGRCGRIRARAARAWPTSPRARRAAVALAVDNMAERDVVFVGHGRFSPLDADPLDRAAGVDGIRLSMAAASIAVWVRAWCPARFPRWA